MPITNLTHKTENGLPMLFRVYFSNSVVGELERVCTLNFTNTTIRPYRRWLRYFYATVEWVHSIDRWLSMLTYGYLQGSIRLPNHTFSHTSTLGTVTYHYIREINGEISVVCDYISLNLFTFKGITILMESPKSKITLKESQLRYLIREAIKKALISA